MSLVTFPLLSRKFSDRKIDLTLDLQSDACPSQVQVWAGETLTLPAKGTHYGFVLRGEARLSRALGEYRLCSGMYFALPQNGTIGGEGSTGFVVTQLGQRVMFSLGGPMEAEGRFSYINGGTDSLLIPPVQTGEPCLNALYFPAGVNQTLHTHPSYRLGLVISGSGLCHTPEETVTFEPGLMFLIPAEQPHRFQTLEEGLTLVVFHPDSDTGFTSHDHPMLRRTFVDGVSAVDLPELQTGR